MSGVVVMSQASAEVVRRTLDEVKDPCSVATGDPLGLDAMGLIEAIEIDAGRVTVHIRLTSPSCLMHGVFIDGIERRVGALPGVHSVEVRFDAGLEWEPGMMRASVRRARERRMRERVAGRPSAARGISDKVRQPRV